MYGVIDIGSNTIRLSVYKLEDNHIVSVINKKHPVGLANYVDDEGKMTQDGAVKTVEALNDFRELLYMMGIDEVYPFATASIRNISNKREILDYIKEETDYDVRLLSGIEEAKFDYYGAIQSVDLDEGLLIDIGGGSTELVIFGDNSVVSTFSLPIGSLNLYKKFVTKIVPNESEIKDIKKEVLKKLDDLSFPKYAKTIKEACGVGGSCRSIKKLMLDMKQIRKDDYKAKELDKLVDLLENDTKFLYDNILKTSADRIHTFAPGLIILKTIIDYFNIKTIKTSNYGVREGYLHSVLEDKGFL